MKLNAIIRIVIWSLVLVILCTIYLGFTMQVIPEETGTIVHQSRSTTFSPREVNALEIQWAAGSITLEPGDVDSITVTESSNNKKHIMQCSLQNKTLSIQYTQEKNIGFGISLQDAEAKDLLIQVPKDWVCRDLELDAASATLNVSDMTLGQVEIDTASGFCAFQDCTVDGIDMDTASGDIRFAGSLNTLDFDGASANLDAVLTNYPRQIDMDTMSGGLHLTLPQDCGFTLSTDTLSSNITSDFDTVLRSGDRIHGDGSCHITVSGLSGDITLRKASS